MRQAPPAPLHSQVYHPNRQQEWHDGTWYDNMPKLVCPPTPTKNPQGPYQRFHYHQHITTIETHEDAPCKVLDGVVSHEFLQEIQETILGGGDPLQSVLYEQGAFSKTTALPFYLTMPTSAEVDHSHIRFCVDVICKGQERRVGYACFVFSFGAYSNDDKNSWIRTVHKFYPTRFYVQLCAPTRPPTKWKLWSFSRNASQNNHAGAHDEMEALMSAHELHASTSNGSQRWSDDSDTETNNQDACMGEGFWRELFEEM